MSGPGLRLQLGLCLAVAATAASLAEDPAERLFVAVSPLTTVGPSSVIVFDVAGDGSLVRTGSYATGGEGRGTLSRQPLAVDADARFLFVANNESPNLTVFTIGAGGGLSPVSTSPFPLSFPPDSMATHPELARLYVPEFFGVLRVYGIEDSGNLQLLQTLDPPRPLRGIAVHPSGAHLYVIGGPFAQTSVHAYDVATDGTLAETAGSPFPVAANRLFRLVVSSDGERLYALDLDRGIFVFEIDAAGSLTPVAGSPFQVGAFSELLALTPDDGFLYTTAPFDWAIHGFATLPDGSLQPVPGSPFTGDFIGAALLPSRVAPHLFFVGRETARISPYGIDPEGRLFVLGPQIDVVDADGRSPNGALLLDLVLDFDIDVKPGSWPNSVNPRSNGVIPVAVLGASGSDVTAIDVSSLHFGPAGAAPVHDGHLDDVDGDEDLDLVVHFRTAETGIRCGDVEARLTGTTVGGRGVRGRDEIVTRGCD